MTVADVNQMLVEIHLDVRRFHVVPIDGRHPGGESRPTSIDVPGGNDVTEKYWGQPRYREIVVDQTP